MDKRKQNKSGRHNLGSSKGFTIVELLVVMVVIGILAAITVVAFSDVRQRANLAALQSDLKNSSTQLEIYKTTNNDSYPPDLLAANLKASPGTSYDSYLLSNGNYCLQATNNDVTYHVHSESRTTDLGPCFVPCPSGFIVVPGSSTYETSDFCVMKYEAKQASSTVPISQATGLPWVDIAQESAGSDNDAKEYSEHVAGCTGCHLITEAEWMTIAQNVLSVTSNWSGGAVGNGSIYIGHSDNSPASIQEVTNVNDGYIGTGNSSPSNQRRTLTLTNNEVIWDFAGNVDEWTSGQTNGTSAQQPGLSGYDYREWSAGLSAGSLSVDPSPSSTELSGSSAWNSTKGMGTVYSSSSDTALRAFIRGGDYSFGAGSGVLMLHMYYTPSSTHPFVGFRVAR